MYATATLGISVFVQLAAAFAALRLIRFTRGRKPWGLICGALLLMVLVRLLVLYYQLSRGEAAGLPDTLSEVLALATSVLLLAGMLWIAPLARSFGHRANSVKESEERYRSLFESSKDALYIADRDGRIIDANQAALYLFGCGKKEMISKRLVDLPVHPDSMEAFRANMEREESVRDLWIKFVGKDGKDIQGLLTSTVWKAGEGSFLGYQCTVRDVTELRLLEEKFLQAQKMEAIGRLAGGIAHDFNNLLMAATGYVDLLTRTLEPGEAPHRYAGEIRKATVRAADLTRQLLAFSRRQVLQPKVIDLNSVVRDLEGMLKRVIGEDVELLTVLAPELGMVKADPGQLEQVIMNLAVNARDAMPDGGKLTIETGSLALDGAYAFRHVAVEPGAYIMLAVSDTGVGIDDKILPHIFDPFFTTKEKGKGTGLGLSTVYGIVKQSGGYIWTYSEPGGGAAFKIYLPRVDDDADPVRQNISKDEPLNGTEAILLVEDEEMVRGLISETLRKSGYTVLEALNGRDALTLCERYAKEKQIHLMLTDVIMPAMGGCELIERVRFLYPRIKIITMSGYTENSIVQRGILESTEAFLSKPFTPDVLKRKIREVLDNGNDAHQVTSPKAEAHPDPVDRSVLESIRGLETERTPDVLSKVVSAYLGSTPKLIETLRETIAAGDREVVWKAAHSLKSSSANVGAMELSMLCKELENMARSNGTEKAGEVFAEIESEYEAVQKVLTVELRKEM